MTTDRLRLALLILVIVLLAACNPTQEPVPVYVTPTPQTALTGGAIEPLADTAAPSPLPSALPPTDQPPTGTPPGAQSAAVSSAPESVVAAAPSATLPPGVTFGPVVGPNSTPVPADTQARPTPAPGVTYGPIVGPNHTLIPTEVRLPPTALPTAVPTAGPSPTPGPGLQTRLMGIQIHPHVDNREFGTMLYYAKDLGMSWVKFQFNWSLLESAPGQYTELFYMLRLYVQQAHSQGFQVMVSVAKAPGWARTPDADGTMREDGPPDDPQVLARFLNGMLNTIGTDATGAPYISAVEVWNEPNLQREWHGHPITGAEYMRYFRPAYDAVRAYSPKITIITAGPAPTGDSAGSTNDRNWLQQVYDAGLAAYGADIAVGTHPYGWANPPDARCCANPSRGWDDQPQFFFLDTIEDYRRIMVANGHGGAQLWATEFGWATFDGLRANKGQGSQPPNPPDAPYFGYINQWQQADYTLRAFQLGQERPYMGPMVLWNLNFATIPGAVDQSNPQTGYGLLDSAEQPRPVYQMLKQAPRN